jgi:hypothetical protein
MMNSDEIIKKIDAVLEEVGPSLTPSAFSIGPDDYPEAAEMFMKHGDSRIADDPNIINGGRVGLTTETRAELGRRLGRYQLAAAGMPIIWREEVFHLSDEEWRTLNERVNPQPPPTMKLSNEWIKITPITRLNRLKKMNKIFTTAKKVLKSGSDQPITKKKSTHYCKGKMK